jgi:hypothetical protein
MQSGGIAVQFRGDEPSKLQPKAQEHLMIHGRAANGRHVVRVEHEEVIQIPGSSKLTLGRTRYYGLYFHEDEVATCWAVETFERSPEGGSQKGYTINLYKDGSTTVMSFEGKKLALESKDRNRFQGTWTFVSGTGRFADIKGGGDYEGESFEGIAYSNVSGNAA